MAEDPGWGSGAGPTSPSPIPAVRRRLSATACLSLKKMRCRRTCKCTGGKQNETSEGFQSFWIRAHCYSPAKDSFPQATITKKVSSPFFTLIIICNLLGFFHQSLGYLPLFHRSREREPAESDEDKVFAADSAAPGRRSATGREHFSVCRRRHSRREWETKTHKRSVIKLREKVLGSLGGLFSYGYGDRKGHGLRLSSTCARTHGSEWRKKGKAVVPSRNVTIQE